MKNLLMKMKWMANQTKPIIPYLILIIIIGSTISVCDIYRAIIMKKLIDSAVASQKNIMINYLFLLAALIISDVVFQGITSIISTRSSFQLTNIIQKRIYKRLTETSWLEFSKYHSGDILTRLTSDADAITSVIVTTIPSITSLLVLLIGSFITLLFIAPLLAFIALIISPLTILLSRIYGSKIKSLYIKGQESEGKYRSFLNETIQNMIIIKTFNLEEKCISQVTSIQNNRLKIAIDRSKVSVFSNSTFSIGAWTGYFIVMIWGGINIANKVITFGTLSALISLFGNIQSPLSGLASSLPKLISATASCERIMELEKMQTDLYNYDIPALASAGVLFENVSFSYNKCDSILKDISFNINPGETVALIGSSGEGKTTLIRILLALINAREGYAYIVEDNCKHQVNGSTRKLISYVPQGNTLFSGTIADNLRYGCPNATDIEIENASRLACAWEFIETLPDGLNTTIGEHGIGLSEGQAQRIAIARALIRKTPILILDEATSALDSNTEVQLLKNIDTLKNNPTCIIITHRPTALKICNRVFKLEEGTLQELFSEISDDVAIEAI